MQALDICNLALSYIGDSAQITSIAPPDGSVQALNCARFYPLAVGMLLEGHEWDFATTRALLVPVSNNYDNWLYAYGQPSNCTQVISVIPQDVYASQLGFQQGYWNSSCDQSWNYWRQIERDNILRWPFIMETNPDGVLVILSNATCAVCRYVSSQFTEASFPSQFTEALAWRLAAMLAGVLIKGDAGATVAARCMQFAMMNLSSAKEQDANQQQGSMRPQPVWMRDR